METIIRQEIKRTADVLIALAQDNALISTIGFVSNLCINALKNGNKILFAGNGGSAADSQHLAAELVSRFNYDRPGLPAMALTTDTSILTAIGNDYGYENLFSRQIKALGKKGDVFMGWLLGVEPRLAGPQPAVLPLNYSHQIAPARNRT